MELACLKLLRVITEPLARAVIERDLTLITVGPLGASRVHRSHLRTVTRGACERTVEGRGPAAPGERVARRSLVFSLFVSLLYQTQHPLRRSEQKRRQASGATAGDGGPGPLPSSPH